MNHPGSSRALAAFARGLGCARFSSMGVARSWIRRGCSSCRNTTAPSAWKASTCVRDRRKPLPCSRRMQRCPFDAAADAGGSETIVAGRASPAQCPPEPDLTPQGILNSHTSPSIANSPFMVGVSGHRDLEPDELPRLREAVTGFVRQLREQLPDTELRMIVGMAQGADLLVAQTALALGVGVEAVLPMPLEQYAADFDAETLASLKKLLQHPDIRCDELSPVTSTGEVLLQHSAAQRDAMYANLTDTLIRRSSLLLALWDGRASHLSGGTADTVLRYLGVRTDGSNALEPIEFVEAHEESDCAVPLVYWTPTARSGIARASDSRTPGFLLGVGENVLQVQHTMPSWLKSQLAELNSYNLEFRRLSDAGRLPIAHSLMAALPVSVPLAGRGPLEDIDAQYRKADALAVYFHPRSDRLFHLFAITAFSMGLPSLISDKLVT